MEMDDNEVPEEISLDTGREKAKLIRKEEKDSQRRIAAEAKLKRRIQSQKKKNAIDADGKGVQEQKTKNREARGQKRKNNVVTDSKQAQDQSMSVTRAKDMLNVNSNELLDDSVVQFLAAQEREHARNEAVDVTAIPDTTDRPVRRLKRSHQTDGVKATNGQLKLVVLEQTASKKSPQDALNFIHDRLFGSRIQRSSIMLHSRKRAKVRKVRK